MKILVAEDDRVSRRMMETILAEWGYDVTTVADGLAAWHAFVGDSALELALLDWSMPGIDGCEVCRRIRSLPEGRAAYLILLTARTSREDIVAGLRGGADDYITKPFDLGELEARLHVGRRMLDLQRKLACRVHQLEDALRQVQHLRGLLPICMYCKSIRDDKNYWSQVDAYLAAHAGARFTHGICPECYDTIVKRELTALEKDRATG